LDDPGFNRQKRFFRWKKVQFLNSSSGPLVTKRTQVEGKYTQLHRVWIWHQYNCFQPSSGWPHTKSGWPNCSCYLDGVFHLRSQLN